MTLTDYLRRLFAGKPANIDDPEVKLQQEERRYRRYVYANRIILQASILLPLVAVTLFIFSFQPNQPLAVSFWGLRVPTALIVSTIFLYATRAVFPLARIDNLRREYDLTLKLQENAQKAHQGNDGYSPREQRAELQLDNHQLLLTKYYDQNLRQNEVVLTFGVIFIGIGLVILLATLVLLQVHPQQGVITATSVIGGLSGLSANIVGVSIIALFRRSTEVTTNLHAEFARTNSLYIASYTASKIRAETTRDQTLSEVAKAVSSLRPRSR